jgi:hypothetical protein
MERAPRPGWHGIPPSRDRFEPPKSLPEPTEGVHWTTENAPAVWAELTYPDDRRQTVKGFAMAWTRELVQVQWVEYSMAREAWVTAGKVRRRQLEERRPHRDG